MNNRLALLLFLIMLCAMQAAYAAAPGRDPNVLPSRVLRPVLRCVVQHHNGGLTAVFGYENRSTEEVMISFGPENSFSPSPERRGQPTSFRPGLHPAVFEVDSTAEELVWTLGPHTATASRDSAPCPRVCPDEQGLDLQRQCLPLEEATNRVVKEDDVHDVGPVFRTEEEAISFVQERVHAYQLGEMEVILNDSGQPSGISVSSTFFGPVFVPHENGTIETFTDPVGTILGGRAGFFTIGEARICVQDSGCGIDPAVDVCDQEFCTSNSSFKHDITIFRTGYTSRGGQTEQTAGGYQEDTHWCRKWAVLPWRCTTKRGTNHLLLNVRFYIGEQPAGSKTNEAHDVEDFTVKIWSVTFNTTSFEQLVTGVCSSHESMGNTFSRTGPFIRQTRADSGDSCPEHVIE